MPSITDDRKKTRGRPKVGATHVGVRIPPEQLAKLDAWRESLNEPPTRPAAVRILLDLGLEAAKK